MSSKSDRRLEAKKRKAVAFLELIKSEQSLKKEVDDLSNVGCGEPVNKKGKYASPSTSVPSTLTDDGDDNHLNTGALKSDGNNITSSASGVITPGLTGSDVSAHTAEIGSSEEPTKWSDVKSGDVLIAYKKELRERQKAAMQRPKIFLTLDELARDNPVEAEPDEVKQVPPLFITDVQHLLLYSLQGLNSSIKPRWCRLLRVGKVSKIVAVVLESVSADDFHKYADSLPTLKSAFDVQVEMVSPLQYGSTVREDILNVPLSMSQMRKTKTYMKSVRKQKDVAAQLSNDCKVTNVILENPLQYFKDQQMQRKKQKTLPDEPVYAHVSTYTRDVFDRTSLLLNTAQLIHEGIPMPVNLNKQHRYFQFTKDEYKPVTSTSPIFAVDCEMVQTKQCYMDLARVSIVNENLETVYDTFVKPWSPVVNYVTRFSGITKEILDPVKTRISDVQRQIREILPPDAILCGQSLSGDLLSMKMFHPYVIDTSVIYNLTGNRRMKTGLKRLTAHFLCRSIQDSQDGHSSVEDAQATIELVLLKLRNGAEFGDMSVAAPSMYTNVGSSTASSEESQPQTKEERLVTKDEEDKVDTKHNSNEECTSKTDDSHNKNSCEIDNITDQNCVTNDIKAEKSNNNLSESDEEKLDNSSNITRSSMAIQQRSNTSDIIQRRLFFQREGNRFIETFIHRISQQKKTGKIIDVPTHVTLYPAALPVISCSTDKDSEKQTTTVLQDNDFCLTHLNGFSDLLKQNKGNKQIDEEEIKKCMWKLDRRLWKIMCKLEDRSLIVVVLAGRQHNMTVYPAMTFAKIAS